MSGRPTWTQAIGGDVQGGNRLLLRTRQVSAKDQPGQLTLKVRYVRSTMHLAHCCRQPGQGTRSDVQGKDLKRELAEREALHYQELLKTDPEKGCFTLPFFFSF